jgi:quercetin dioxygenase-like cupin family protein
MSIVMLRKNKSTRRNLLNRAVVCAGAATLQREGAHAQGALPNGLVVSAEAGINWEMSPGRSIRYKLMSDQTGDEFSTFEETAPAGAGTPLHIHRTSDEVIHLMSGELIVRLGANAIIANPGAWIYIPRGMTHGWRTTAVCPFMPRTRSPRRMVESYSRSYAH